MFPDCGGSSKQRLALAPAAQKCHPDNAGELQWAPDCGKGAFWFQAKLAAD